MKMLSSILFGLVLIGFTMLISCGEDSDPLEDAINRLSKTWGNATVQLDGVDVTTPSYDNFTITFRTDGSYTTTDGDPVFKATGGFWEFSNQINFGTILVDGVTMSVSLNTNATTLNLSFNAPGAPIGARVAGLEGSYVFNLSSP